MVPAIGDIIGNRYTLIAQYRSEPGLSAWLANDHTLMRDCQLFIVSDSQKLPQVNALASSLALSHDPHFTRVLRFQREEGASVIVTETDPGISLNEFIQQQKQRTGGQNTAKPTVAVETMRTICGKTIEAVTALRKHSLNNHALSTHTVRLTKNAITIADTAVSPMLTTPLKPDSPVMNDEELAIKQIGSLLFEIITGVEYDPHKDGATYAQELRKRDAEIPGEFESICVRTLGLPVQATMESERPIPILTLLELEMLLGSTWKEPKDLPQKDYDIPQTPGTASIETVTFASVDLHDVNEIPASLFTKNTVQDGGAAAAKKSAWDRNDLLFNGPESVEQITPDSDEDFFSMFSDDQSRKSRNRNVSNANRRAASQFGGQSGTAGNSAGQQSGTNSSRPVSTSSKVIPLSNEDSPRSRNAADSRNAANSRDAANAAHANAAQGSAANSDAEKGTQKGSQQGNRPGAPVSFAVKPQSAKAQKSGKSMKSASARGAANEESKGISNKTILWTVISILVVLLVWAMVQLNVGSLFTGDTDTSAWTIDANTTPLPNGQKNPSANEGTKKSTSSSTSSSQKTTDSSSKSSDSSSADTKVASAVPAPAAAAATANTTPYAISSIRFVRSSTNVAGYGLYIHLAQPEQVSQVKITLRSGGGQASLYANSTPTNPNNGAALAQFSFADGGQPTTITLSSPTTTQDLMIWVTSRVPAGFHYRTVQVL